MTGTVENTPSSFTEATQYSIDPDINFTGYTPTADTVDQALPEQALEQGPPKQDGGETMKKIQLACVAAATICFGPGVGGAVNTIFEGFKGLFGKKKNEQTA